ncbi:uncharacterized protein LOC124935061 [Impatiens glandulifera]|uniref:uncharacterized protein LOC124935061 n=1 Tax=Impatiens glandulifera TaxID=253017 RepID=UPI001FB10B39|nr:uncharacterized protein LOC124935061 [Impatiens glandulifera]
MQVYLVTLDDDMMYVISYGPIKINKERSEWTNDDKRKNNLDNLAKNAIYNTLDRNTFAKIRACSITKEVWEKIIQLNEGNKRTKEKQIMVATQKIENVKMRHGETMKEFSDRFTSIVNELFILGKTYANKETIVKVLTTLPSAWDVKITVMRESRSLQKMQLHDVFEELKAYEFEMNSRNEDEYSTLTVTRALVSSVEPTAPVPIKSVEQFRDDAMSLSIKKLGLYKSECQKPRTDDKKPTDQKPREDYQPSKHNNEVQKALLADDGESKWAQNDSDSDNEEVRCFMTNDEEVFDFASKEFTREDLIIALNDIVIEYKNLSNLVSTQPDNQTGRTLELTYENERLKEKVQVLTKENERMNYVIAAWTKYGDEVNQMTRHQRPANCKFGLGYDNSNSDKSCEMSKPKKDKFPFISFVKSTSIDTKASHDTDELEIKKQLK